MKHQRQSYFGVRLNIPNLEDMKIEQPNIEPFIKTSQRFGNLAQNYEDLNSSYRVGLVEGVIEGGKLGIQKGIELTEDEAKAAVKDYQQKIGAQAKQVVQQAKQQVQKQVDNAIEQNNRIAFSHPTTGEILHVKSLTDMFTELENITGKTIKTSEKNKKLNTSYGKMVPLNIGGIDIEVMEKWNPNDPGNTLRNKYLQDIGVPIPQKVSTPKKVKKTGGKT